MLTINMTVIGKAALDAKLLALAPRILATNRALVTAMLEHAKPIVYANTPVGPGHFGYHGRDTLRIEVTSRGVKTSGELLAKVQLYWREKGTKQGERAYMTAHKAMGSTKRFISAYYGGMANWWKS